MKEQGKSPDKEHNEVYTDRQASRKKIQNTVREDDLGSQRKNRGKD